MKNIILVGVSDKKGSTNIPMVVAFTRFDYNTIPINYRTIIQKYGLDYLYGVIVHAVEKYQPELVLFSKCNGISSDIIKICNEYTKTWLWNMDPIETIKRCPEVLEHARYATYSSCTSPTITQWFMDQGVPNCYYIPQGFDHDVEKPIFPTDEYRATISFIGSRTPIRDKFYEVLLKNDIDARFYGSGYGQNVYDLDFSRVCASSDFMLSINTYEIPDYCSNRILRYAGCGSCILHYDPNDNNLGNIFDKEKEIKIFHNEEELLNLILTIPPEERRNLTINARERALQNYTYNHTISKILGVLHERIN